MKRVVIGALILALFLGAVWTVSSYWFGIETEARYRSMMMQSSSWGQARMVNESYERGIFRSHAKTVVEIGQTGQTGNAADESPPAGPMRIALVEDISHGPVAFMTEDSGQTSFRPALAVIETKISIDPQETDTLKELQKFIPKDATMRINTVLPWKGDGETKVSIKPFRHESGQDQKVGVDFGGLEAQAKFSLDLKRFAGNLACEKLLVDTAEDGLYQLGRIQGTFDQFRGAAGLFLGDVDFMIDQFEFQRPQDKSKGKEPFRMKGFRVKTSGRESGNDLSTSAVSSMDQVGVGGVGADKAHLEIEFRRLDGKAVYELQDAIHGLRDQQNSGDDAPGQALVKAVELLTKILKNSPEMEIKRFGFTTPEGELQSAAKLAVDGSQVGDSLNLLTLMNASNLNARVDVSEKLLVRMLRSTGKKSEEGTEGDSKVETDPDAVGEARVDGEVQEQLADLVAQGYLKLENGTYKTSASYAKGKLTVNQRDVPLDQVLGQ